jgi:hypothetical protein
MLREKAGADHPSAVVDVTFGQQLPSCRIHNGISRLSFHPSVPSCLLKDPWETPEVLPKRLSEYLRTIPDD